MQAFISPAARLAGVVDGDNAWLIRAHSAEEPDALGVDTLQSLFATQRDTLFFPEMSLDAARAVLKTECEKDDALLLSLIALSTRSDSEIQSRAARFASESFRQPHCESHVRRVLFSRPLTEDAVTTLSADLAIHAERFHILATEVLASQPTIQAIQARLAETLRQLRIDPSDEQRIFATLVHTGSFVVLARTEATKSQISAALFECLRQLSDVRQSRALLQKLFGEFGARDGQTLAIPTVRRDSADEEPSYSKQSAHKTFTSVMAQIERIEELLQAGKEDLARKFADELVREQSDRGEHFYASMSLCNLSEKAKQLRNYSLQLTWAERAARVAPGDARAHAHMGEALLRLNRFEEARQAFARTRDAGDATFAANGLARVLRAAAQYDDALRALEELDVSAQDSQYRNLHATLLRDAGRYDDAIACYSEILRDYPEDRAAMCGLASVHGDRHRFSEAREIYQRVITMYPSDHVALTGLGNLLIRQGHYLEGLKYLEEGIKANVTDDIVPLASKINALRLRGKHAAALELVSQRIEAEPYEIEWRLAKALCLVDARDYTAAAEVLGKAKDEFGTDANPRLRRLEALIFRRQGRLQDALLILDQLKQSHPAWLDALVDRANVLKQMGEYLLANEQLTAVLKRRPNHRSGRAALAILTALRSPSLPIDVQPTEPVTPGDWRAQLALGLSLLGSRRLSEAKRIFALGSKKCPFAPIRAEFDTPLAAVRTLLRQIGPAVLTIKNPRDDIGLIQRAIVLGELGKLAESRAAIQKVNRSRPDTHKVVQLVSVRYALAQPEPAVTVDRVMDEQVALLLRAA